MNSDILKGKWNQVKGTIKQQWGDLTDNDVARIEGNYDEFVGVLRRNAMAIPVSAESGKLMII